MTFLGSVKGQTASNLICELYFLVSYPYLPKKLELSYIVWSKPKITQKWTKINENWNFSKIRPNTSPIFFYFFWHRYNKYFEGFSKKYTMGYFGDWPSKCARWNSDRPPFLAHSAFIFEISPQVSYPVRKRTPRAF